MACSIRLTVIVKHMMNLIFFSRRKELFADYFDEGRQSEAGLPVFTKKSQIRFPKDRGIAGYVAQTGEVKPRHL